MGDPALGDGLRGTFLQRQARRDLGFPRNNQGQRASTATDQLHVAMMTISVIAA